VLIDSAHATNPCCEHAHLIEENTKLKEQLEKRIVSCIGGEKNLNELLINQKEVVAKGGLGFAPKTKEEEDKQEEQYQTNSPSERCFCEEGRWCSKGEEEQGGGW
jgi:hypothetical protein